MFRKPVLYIIVLAFVAVAPRTALAHCRRWPCPDFPVVTLPGTAPIGTGTGNPVPLDERTPRGSRPVFVHVNGRHVDFPDVFSHWWPAEGRTFVPVRFVAERLGATVTWNHDTQEVLIELPGRRIELEIGRQTATVNGTAVELEIAPFLFAALDRHRVLQGRTLVPLRLVSEGLGARVEWVPPSPENIDPRVLITFP